LSLLNSVALNGVILISAALDPRIFVSGAPGNELNYVTNLPTYAATAYYHDQLPTKPDDLEAFLQEAREFAATDYLTALFQGDSLPEARAAEMASELHRFTGLSEAYLRRANLRVNTRRFLKELLRDRGETVAHHDTRFRGRDADDAGEFVDWDPFLLGIAGPFVTAINSYLGGELGVHGMDRPYQVFALGAGAVWKRPQAQSHVFAGYLNTTGFLAAAAATNQDFRVFAGSGYHDLTTTFFGVEYTFDHSRIDKDRITLRNYYGGHMMYLYEDSLAELAADIRAFIVDRHP
ncbi:MAG: peptidase S10, partial [Acidobacteriota bacterium]